MLQDRPRRRWLRRLLLALSGLVAVLVLVAGGGFLWLRSSLPQLDGTISMTATGLQHAVSIDRDDDGYVAIRADSDSDAAFALGFAHAQDRLFQMDGMRRLGSGRLSEIIGPAG
ncbi:MAG TPA: penicillin acylase family protein, partial [Dongiaceae bacterium]